MEADRWNMATEGKKSGAVHEKSGAAGLSRKQGAKTHE
jgi:hypothetical protein